MPLILADGGVLNLKPSIFISLEKLLRFKTLGVGDLDKIIIEVTLRI